MSGFLKTRTLSSLILDLSFEEFTYIEVKTSQLGEKKVQENTSKN